MSDHYVSAVEFSTPRAGDYAMRVDTDVKAEVMVQPPLSQLFIRRASWLVVIGTGWFVAVVGAAMIIVGSTRRNRAERITQSQTPTLPSAQWYADPLGERRLRYWDGWRWTDHTAD